MTTSQALADYLRRQAALPYTLGQSDCCCLVADWLIECRGIDPMADCPRYFCTAEANDLLCGMGGLPRAVGRSMRQFGIRMTRAPLPGDVAVVAIRDMATCAIRTERRWAVRLFDGLALLPPERVRVIAAWRVN